MLLSWDTMGRCFFPILCQWDDLLISEHLWRGFSPNFSKGNSAANSSPSYVAGADSKGRLQRIEFREECFLLESIRDLADNVMGFLGSRVTLTPPLEPHLSRQK